MPDDSSQEFKASQSQHAQSIKITRELSRITGVPASQIRRATREQKKTQSATTARTTDVPAPVSQTNNFGMGPSALPNGFNPRPFAPDPSAVGGGTAPQEGPLPTTQLIVDNNGTLEYWNFNAVYDSDV